MSEHSAEKDVHAGCLTAWERERTQRQFIEARLNSLIIELRHLAQAMDGISGHTAHERLGGRTLGGAVRFVANGEPAPRVTPPGSSDA